MFKKVIPLMSILLFTALQGLVAQDGPGGLKVNFAPASPEAAMLFKFQDIPVSKYTGTADISIPLVNAAGKTTGVPISLSYHTSGNKVDEVASYTGLGWKLNAGGMISRKVKGIPDDAPRGKINQAGWKTNIYNLATPFNNTINGWTVLLGLTGSRYDGEPDEFYFSFNGYSGKMSFRDTGSANPGDPLVVSSDVPLKVNYRFANGGISEWQIVTPDGLKYTFAALERTRTEKIPHETDPCNPLIMPVEEYTSSWFLTDISSVNGFSRGEVHFTYDDYNTDYETIKTNTETHTAWSGSNCILAFPNTSTHVQLSNSRSRTYIKGKKLKQITIPESRIYIDFIYNNRRLDLPATINDRSLDAIVVSRDTGSGMKRIEKAELKYFYQGNRLMLKSVQKIANDESMPVPPYEFAYNTVSLPDRIAGRENIDHWGYFNNGGTLLPSYAEVNVPGWNYVNLNGGSDRDPDFVKTKAQVLEKITYPTGGTTQLDYEQNEYSFLQNEALEDKDLYFVRDTTHSVYSSGQGFTSPDYNIVSKVFSVSAVCDATFEYNAFLAPCNSNPDGGVFCGPGILNFPVVSLFQFNPAQNNYSEVFSYKLGINNTQGTFPKTLQPGTYKLEAKATTRPFQKDSIPGVKLPDNVTFNVSFTYNSSEKVIRKKMGGLRVKQVSDHDSIGNVTKIRRYDYNMQRNGHNVSSGVIYAEPKYIYNSYPIHTYPNSTNEVACLNRTIVGSSQVILGETSGSPVGYQQVTDWEVYKGQPNGKIVTNYTSPVLYPDLINAVKPFGSPESYAYKTGLVLSENYYNSDGQVVKKDSFEYAFKEEALLSVKASKGLVDCPCPNPNGASVCRDNSYMDVDNDGINDFFAISNNRLILGFPRISREIHMQDGFTIEKGYEYDNSLQLAKRIVVKNNATDKDSSVVLYKYPGDEGSMQGLTPEELEAIGNMKSIGMTAAVLEEQKQRQGINTIRIRNHYKNFDAFGHNQTAMSGMSIQNGTEPMERKYDIEQYDLYGNVRQQRRSNDLPYSYVWDDLTGNPAAEVNNATSNNIAFTSFESFSNIDGGWYIGSGSAYVRTSSDVLTGRYAYQLVNGSISKNGLSAGNKYIVSYWSKNGAYNVNGIPAVAGKTNDRGWTYYEHITGTATTSVTVSGYGLIDELRLYPEKAEMVTYTYEVGTGILSRNSADNIIAYYEYDVMNRLKALRDQDGNILQLIDYQYRKQERSTAPGWKDVFPGEMRCETGMDIGAGNIYNTGYRLKKQVDSSLYSPTYNQFRWERMGIDAAACPITPDWQYYGWECVSDACGNRTGQYKNIEKDKNPYSPTYNQTRLTGIIGTNTTICPVTPACTGEGYRKINNVCVLGRKVEEPPYDEGCYRITIYHYEWDCGPNSGNFRKSVKIPGCTIPQ
jgi:hypothetical protein